jgi:hypothetical protein
VGGCSGRGIVYRECGLVRNFFCLVSPGLTSKIGDECSGNSATIEGRVRKKGSPIMVCPWMKQKERKREKTCALAKFHVGEDFHETCIVEGTIRPPSQAKDGLSCVACFRVLEVIGVAWLFAREPVTLLRY